MDSTQLMQLFNDTSYYGESHLSSDKVAKRLLFLFKRTLKDDIFEEERMLETSFFFLEVILSKLKRKIPHQHFISVYINCLYLGYSSYCPEKHTLEDFYHYFDLYIHYVALEDLHRWQKSALVILGVENDKNQSCLC
eukprot:gene5476-9294_t